MPSINIFKRQVASSPGTDESKATSLLNAKLDDSAMSTSVTSTRTDTTVATDFSDETRQDFQRMPSDFALSEDEEEDDWRNDFLSPGSAIAKDLQGGRSKIPTLSPVPSSGESSQESAIPSTQNASLSESQEQVITSSPTTNEKPPGLGKRDSSDSSTVPRTPNAPLSESQPRVTFSDTTARKPPGHVRKSSLDSLEPIQETSSRRGHNRHRSMTEVPILGTPPRGHRRSNTMSPSGAKPPTHRRSSSMNSQKLSPPLSPTKPLTLDTLYATVEMRAQKVYARHFSVGQTWNLIGNHHFRHQEFSKAIEAYENALTCDQGCVEPRDSDHITAAYGNIGTVCWSTGDIERSVTCFEKALKLRMESELKQGVDLERSLPVAACRHQLGLALSLKKDYTRALEELSQALRIRETVLGRKTMEVARTLDAIGKIHMFRGVPDGALRCHQEAYAITIALSGERGPVVIASLKLIAAAHLARGDLNDAIFTSLAVRDAQSREMQKAAQAEDGPTLTRLAQEAGETSQMLVDLFTKTRSFQNAQLAVNEALGLYQQAGLKEDHPKMQALKESVKTLQKATMQS